MLEELREELRLGPDEQITASFCFSVVQGDKTRRCEDFKRSGLNDTVEVHDAPHHDDIPVYVELVKAFAALHTANLACGIRPRSIAY